MFGVEIHDQLVSKCFLMPYQVSIPVFSLAMSNQIFLWGVNLLLLWGRHVVWTPVPDSSSCSRYGILTGVNLCVNLISGDWGRNSQDTLFIWLEWLVWVGPEWYLGVYVRVEGRKGLSLALDSMMYTYETWNCCSYFNMMEASLRQANM